MREVFTHKEFTLVGHYQTLLEAEGIPTFIPALFPVLCVENDADFDRAVEIIRKVYKPEPNNLPDWPCTCGELVPGNFDTCWKCGAEPAQSAKTTPPVENTTATAPLPAPGGTEYHRAVAALRLLLLLDLVFTIGFAIAGTSIYLHTYTHHPNSLTPLVDAYSIFSPALGVVSIIMCIALTRTGRIAYTATIALNVLSTLGSTGGVLYRVPSAISYLSAINVGAVLAMLYLSPAAVYFKKKSEYPKIPPIRADSTKRESAEICAICG
jgi:hypothetical protein